MMQRNASLDTLRALAVTGVFVHHLFPGTTTLGDRGVDLFFVLSGYLIGGIVFARYERDGTIAPLAFWRDRWLRTLPAYYAALAIYMAKDFLAGKPVLETFGPYIGFLQSYVAAPDQLPRFHHSWSLCVEEHFYLALPLLLLLLAKLRRQSLAMPVILVIGLALVVVRTVYVETGGDIQIKLTHWRTDALVVGVLLAKLDQRAWFRPWLAERRRGLAIATVLALAAAAYIDIRHNTYFELPVALAFGMLLTLGIANLVILEIPGKTRVVAWIARISYSVYLVQPLVLMEVAKRNLPERFGTAGWLAMIAASTALTLIASQLLYMFVEKPGLALRERLRARRKAREAMPRAS